MRVLIVEDDRNAARRIKASLDAEPDLQFLVLTDGDFAFELAAFGVRADVALIDLRLKRKAGINREEYDGFAVCQKIRRAMPEAVVVGYSSSFSVDSGENEGLKEKFRAMGADLVWALDHLTLTPVSELRFEFESVKRARDHQDRRNFKDKVFVGSSKEGLPVAREIQKKMQGELEVVLWTDTVFGLGETTMEALEKSVRRFDFAVFVFTPDDERLSRGKSDVVARDNVIFEAGLFIGSIGRLRAFIVVDSSREIGLPSDLKGLTVAKFDGKTGNLSAALGGACVDILGAVARLREG